MILVKKYRVAVFLVLASFFALGCAGTRNVNSQSLKQFNISKEGNRYVLNGETDLKGYTLTLPPKMVFDCRNGVLTNGGIKGGGNKVLYEKPFIGKGLKIEGCYVEDKNLYSEKVLVRNGFSDEDIHNVFSIALDNSIVVYEAGTYKNITEIDINKNITLDFSNSTIETVVDRYGLSNSVFLMSPDSQQTLENVTIKNLSIDGKMPRYGIESGVGPRRNAIRLIGVENVTLENVSIRNFRMGTSGDYAKDIKKRYMAGVCAIMNYKNCTIRGCSLSKNTGEGFYLVPEESQQNYLLFRGNKISGNYGTFLTLVDGRCLVENNEMDVFGLSGMNLFCYNSIIRNNRFKGGEKFNCIDITENGIY